MKKPVKEISVGLGCVLLQNRPIPNFSDMNDSKAPFKILLVKRIREEIDELNDKWELPGGKVEENEFVSQAVEREVFEETGYKVSAVKELERVFVFYRDYPEYKQHTYISCYLTKLDSERQFDHKANIKIGEIKWFDPNEIDYKNTLVGSREFISDILDIYNYKVNPLSDKVTTYISFEVLNRNEFSKIDRFGRKYNLIIQYHPNSIDKYSLITYRRGINKRGKNLLEKFSNFEELEKKAKDRIRTRFYHGYTAIKIENDFPFKDWIMKKKYPYTQKVGIDFNGIQLNLPLD